jgi:hypothetical protein
MNLVGLYIIVALYLISLGATGFANNFFCNYHHFAIRSGVYYYYIGRNQVNFNNENVYMNFLSSLFSLKPVTVTSHYLGNRSFGKVLFVIVIIVIVIILLFVTQTT